MKDDNIPRKTKARLLICSTGGAVIGGLLGGFLGSGIFDGITGSGLPNPGGAIGAIVGAFGGGYFTMKFLRQRIM